MTLTLTDGARASHRAGAARGKNANVVTWFRVAPPPRVKRLENMSNFNRRRRGKSGYHGNMFNPCAVHR
ncbi:MAG TPA: hypothetical protein VFB31_04205 [Pseudolabrys sp.]|nr:hypothetical protein [Pseudolabrys sp.]